MAGIDRRRLLAVGGAFAAASVVGRRAVAQAADSTTAGPPSLGVFAATPFVDQIALSPDGQQIAFITPAGDASILGSFDLTTRASRTYPLGKVKIHDLFWGDNKRVVLVTSKTASLPQKGEFTQAQIIDLDTHVVSLLFDGMGVLPIVYGNLGRIKVKDKYFVTASRWFGEGQPNLVLDRFDPARRIFPATIAMDREVEGWVITPTGVPMGYSTFHDSGNSAARTWSLYCNTEPEKNVFDYNYKKVLLLKGGKDFPTLMGLGRDGTSLLIAIKDDDGAAHYREVSLDGTVSPPLEAVDRLGATPLFSPVSGALAGFSYSDDTLVYDYADPLMKKLVASVPQIIGEDYHFTLIDFAEDPRKMIVYGESATDAGSYFFIDFSTGKGFPINANYPDLPKAWITRKQPIHYTAADGLDIHGYLTLPPGKTPKDLPLIVLPHGGPKARDYGDFDWEAQAFASRGYAVLQPNFRGSAGYGPAFIRAGYGEWGGKMQSDLIDGIQALAAQGLVDAKRVAIYGTSYGGYAALAGATLDPVGTYTCAVSIAGVSDIRQMLSFDAINDDIGSQGLSLQLEKDMLGDPARYDAISPARQAAKAYCPILLIHGTDDTVVPIDQSQRMERALKDAGKPVRFVTLDHQTHWEDIASARLAMIEAAMTFIGEYNPA